MSLAPTAQPLLPPGPLDAGPSARLVPRLAFWLSGGLSVAIIAMAAVSLLLPDWLYGVANAVGSARGTALVLLAVDLPVLVLGMWLASRGSGRGLVLWLGSTAYAGYNAVAFGFGMSFNRLFLLYAALLGFAFWSLVVLLSHVDADRFARSFDRRLPVRAIGGYLVGVSALFAMVWLKDILPANANGSVPSALVETGMTTNPFQLIDLAVSLPTGILAGILLWQRRPWGYVLSGLMLVMLAIEAFSIAVDQWFAHLADPAFSAAAVPAFLILTAIQLVPLVAYLTRLRRPAPADATPVTM